MPEHLHRSSRVHGVTGDVVGTDGVQTLTGKTLTSPTINNPTVTGLNSLNPTGAVLMFGGSSAPTGYLLCDGSAVSRTTYSALFAVLGTAYGIGDGSTTFNIPNFTNRFPYGTTPGTTGGSATKTLTVGNLPPHQHDMSHNHPSTATTSDSHSHTVPFRYGTNTPTSGSSLRVNDIDGQDGAVGTAATAHTSSDAHSHTVNLPSYAGNTGTGSAQGLNGDPLDVTPPYLGVAFIIKT